MTRRETVITGLGPVTGYGVGLEPLWSAMLDGRSAIKPITRFDASGLPTGAGAETPDSFNVREVVPKSYRKATKVMARDIELAVGAALNAVEHAQLRTKGTHPDEEPTIPATRFGCHIGAGLIAADVEELTAALVSSKKEDGSFDLHAWGESGMQNLTPLWLLKYLPNMLSCHVTIIHDCQGPSNTITCAEASGLLSLGESRRAIERGVADACLSGGAESKLNPMGVLRQIFAKRLAPTPEGTDPATIIRPYGADATGTLMGEGGGLVIIESRESAEARGATMYASVAGYGASQSHCPDVIGLTLEEDGQGILDAIENALDNAGLKPEQIDAIVPAGLGIAAIDASEAAAITRCFGPRAASIPLVTTVPFVGNTGAGAGAINVIVAAKMLEAQQLPARLNTHGVKGLDANAASARKAELRHVLVLTTSLGGQNAAVILAKQ